MITLLVHKHIEEVLAGLDSRDRVEQRIEELSQVQSVTISETERRALVDQLEQYVRGTPTLLHLAAAEAADHGISAYVDPMIEAAAHYFLDPLDAIADRYGLYGLLDDAYLAQSLLAGLSQLHLQLAGVPLIGAALAPANEVVRGVIGEPVASQLDAEVTSGIHQVSVQAQLDVLAQQAVTLQASPTGGPGAWGGTWEDEMARIGAEAGISIDW